jgi:hypothetical protein
MQDTHFKKFQRWAALSLLNFCIVAVLGILLRYKIAFSLPLINYNYILEAHSHFAFSGWVSTAVFTALVYILAQSGFPVNKIYTYQFYLLQTASYGMLLAFSIKGYGWLSIFFSLVFILFSWWFAFQYWKDVSRSELSIAVRRSSKAALFFLVLSGTGILVLFYLQYHRIDSPEFYFNALYLFLHFQYNGWFSFGVMALFFHVLDYLKTTGNEVGWTVFFRLMLGACIPAYFLSLLWMSPPSWVFAVAAMAGILQLSALVVLFFILIKSRIKWTRLNLQTKLMWGLSLTSFLIKLILQACSVIPVLGRLAFGFRPVIIAYLHLVMLGFISFFLIGFFIRERLFHDSSRTWKMGLLIFVAGVLIMEFLLFIQALSAINNSSMSFTTILFITATILLAGLSLMLTAQLKWKINKWK